MPDRRPATTRLPPKGAPPLQQPASSLTSRVVSESANQRPPGRSTVLGAANRICAELCLRHVLIQPAAIFEFPIEHCPHHPRGVALGLSPACPLPAAASGASNHPGPGRTVPPRIPWVTPWDPGVVCAPAKGTPRVWPTVKETSSDGVCGPLAIGKLETTIRNTGDPPSGAVRAPQTATPWKPGDPPGQGQRA
jgi:hypothetical protein